MITVQRGKTSYRRGRTCKTCGKKIRDDSVSGYCREHYRQTANKPKTGESAHYLDKLPTRACKKCGAKIDARNTTGACINCYNEAQRAEREALEAEQARKYAEIELDTEPDPAFYSGLGALPEPVGYAISSPVFLAWRPFEQSNHLREQEYLMREAAKCKHA